ncbi:ligase [Bacteroides pyogenes]|uniref:ligase n=1 Tax=Bacteroides pyogenes TaxID=310300 RepID=UPI002FDB8B0B
MNGEKRYIAFGVGMLITQVVGYNIVTMAFFALSMLFIISSKSLFANIRYTPFFIFFLILSLGIGGYFGLCKGLEAWNIPYWGQFYFLCFALLCVDDKQSCLNVLRLVVYCAFILDLSSNLLMLAGIDIPWTSPPPIRPGETLARFTGFKGNALYSGSITFCATCYALQENYKYKQYRYPVLCSMIVNLILSGSYRYLIIGTVVGILYYLHLYKNKLLLIGMYVVTIISVLTATFATAFTNLSNFYRVLIWTYFTKEIAKAPWIGHGFFNIHLQGVEDFISPYFLINKGVTESCILTLAYNFGLPILFLFLLSIFKTLTKYPLYPTYRAELGLFIGLSLDLFWGGSFDNTLTFSLLIISLYTINARTHKEKIS